MHGTRRVFLRRSLGTTGLLALAPSAPQFLARAAAEGSRVAGPPDRDTVLVVLQLAGGNDGLNTVVPFEDDRYARARPTLRLPAREVHRINDQLGFHPRMEALWRCYQEGMLNIVQGVGYPNPNGGHFESMHFWQTAQPGDVRAQTGWLGRALDWRDERDPGALHGAYAGRIALPFTLNGEHAIVPTMRSLDELSAFSGGAERSRRDAMAGGAPRVEPAGSLLEYVQRTSAGAIESGKALAAAGQQSQRGGQGEYPAYQFAEILQVVAALIRADVGLRIIYTELGGQEPGGFDNHASQAENHAALLHQLSESVAAFLRDLKRDGALDRVVLMSFSEFGRTTRENGRRGTDHGSAAPLFVAGGRVAGGLTGDHPDLDEVEGGGLKHAIDFRRVYATLLDQWLGFDAPAILGRSFEPLPIWS